MKRANSRAHWFLRCLKLHRLDYLDPIWQLLNTHQSCTFVRAAAHDFGCFVLIMTFIDQLNVHSRIAA